MNMINYMISHTLLLMNYYKKMCVLSLFLEDTCCKIITRLFIKKIRRSVISVKYWKGFLLYHCLQFNFKKFENISYIN